MERPTGVTVLGFVYYISTCLSALVGVGSMVGMGFLSHMVAQKPDTGGLAAMLMAGAGIFLGVFFFFLALTYRFLARAMLELTSWAPRLGVILSVFWMIVSMMSLNKPLWRLSHVAFFAVVIHVGAHIVIIWYLTQAHVQAAFATAALPARRVSPLPPALSGQPR